MCKAVSIMSTMAHTGTHKPDIHLCRKGLADTIISQTNGLIKHNLDTLRGSVT